MIALESSSDVAEIARACTTWCRPTSSGRAPRSPWPRCAISGIATDPVGAGCSGLAGRQRRILARDGLGRLRTHDATLTQQLTRAEIVSLSGDTSPDSLPLGMRHGGSLMSLRRVRRRTFIAGLGSAAAWPMLARAQQSGKTPRIGVLWHAANEQEEAVFLNALRQGLNYLGYIEGKNIEVLNRFAGEHYDRFDALAKDLIDAKVDVIVASTGFAALAAKRATSTIPIVFVAVPDPIGLHLVESLAHPGGNLTGFATMSADLVAKRLELLRDCLPKLSSVVLLHNPKSEVAGLVVGDAQNAARSANIKLSLVEAQTSDELEPAFLTIVGRKPDAVIVGVDAMLYNERAKIAELAIAHRLPVIAGTAQQAQAGLLMSYGADGIDIFRRAAIFVDKILKGAKPGDLPVEQPTKFQLIVNSRTAHEIGVAIPDSIELRADEVIE